MIKRKSSAKSKRTVSSQKGSRKNSKAKSTISNPKTNSSRQNSKSNASGPRLSQHSKKMTRKTNMRPQVPKAVTKLQQTPGSKQNSLARSRE
jgi:hypothetical protein